LGTGDAAGENCGIQGWTLRGACGVRRELFIDAPHAARRTRHEGNRRQPCDRRDKLASFHRAAILREPSLRRKARNRMHFETRIEPLNGKLPKVSYRWDPETDILTVACKGVPKGNGMNGTVDLEGGDGSFVVIDVAGGALRGVDIVTWPDDVRTVAALEPPATSKEGQVTFPGRRSQPGVAAVEVDTPLTVDRNPTESVFHIRVGRQRPATVVRVADHMLVEVDKQSRIAGLWLLEVPPFPNVEATA
jgi:hypothetical protein